MLGGEHEGTISGDTGWHLLYTPTSRRRLSGTRACVAVSRQSQEDRRTGTILIENLVNELTCPLIGPARLLQRLITGVDVPDQNKNICISLFYQVFLEFGKFYF